MTRSFDRTASRGGVILVSLTLTSAALVAQTPAPQLPTFTSRVTQVEVYASVTGKDGRAIRGLSQQDFTVLEDGVPQAISTFVGGDFPAAVALAFDRSFSMKGTPLTMARTAGRAFVGSLKPEDRAMLISISGEVEVLSPLSADKGPMLTQLEALDPWGSTSLYDAIVRSLDLLEHETGRRAIVILSDGEDRYSTTTAAAVIERARRSDILIYPIAIGRERPPLFAELASVTGGQSFHVRNPRALSPTLQAIAEDLRSQYLLGYAPGVPWPQGEADWRRITVKVNRADGRVRARSGYSTK